MGADFVPPSERIATFADAAHEVGHVVGERVQPGEIVFHDRLVGLPLSERRVGFRHRPPLAQDEVGLRVQGLLAPESAVVVAALGVVYTEAVYKPMRADREFAYTAGAERALAAAAEHGWTVASIEDDWATVFA